MWRSCCEACCVCRRARHSERYIQGQYDTLSIIELSDVEEFLSVDLVLVRDDVLKQLSLTIKQATPIIRFVP